MTIAETRLGGAHSPITAIDAKPRDANHWTVVFVFSQGEPELVVVSWTDGKATASDPGPVPTDLQVPIP